MPSVAADTPSWSNDGRTIVFFDNDRPFLRLGAKGRPRQSALSRPAVEIRTREGRIFSCTPDGVPGDPAHPVGWDLLEAKFRDCVSFAHRPLVQGGADRMIELVQNLDCLDDVTEITRLFG